MVDGTLLFSAALGILVAAVFIATGHRLRRRDLEGSRGRAWMMFSAWWYGMGAVTALHGAAMLPVAFGYADVALTVLLSLLLMPALATAYTGLTGYLLYILSGRHRLFPAVVGMYVGYALVVVYAFLAADPVAVVSAGWAVSTTFGGELTDGVAFVLGPVTAVLLLVPPLGLIVSYGFLYRRVRGPSARRRLIVVAAGLGFMLLASLASLMSVFAANAPVQVGTRLVAAAAAGAVLVAYAPPRWARRWWGVRGVVRDDAREPQASRA